MEQIITSYMNEIGWKLFISIVLGGTVGLERELKGKPAGLRTNILISVGSTAIMIISTTVAKTTTGSFLSDPGRIAAQVVTGVGFLCAGTILQSRETVAGLTTAATIWVVASIGLAVGAGYFSLAIGTTVVIIVCLFVLGELEGWFVRKSKVANYRIVLDEEDGSVEILRNIIDNTNVSIDNLQIIKKYDNYVVSLDHSGSDQENREFVRQVLGLRGVKEVLRM